MAYCGKYFDKSSYRIYCVMGDGECSEGSVWEAVEFAVTYKLDNLVAIVDVNRLGQVCVCVCVYLYIYSSMCLCVCVCVYII